MKTRFWIYSSILILGALIFAFWPRPNQHQVSSELKTQPVQSANPESKNTNSDAQKLSASNQAAVPYVQGSSNTTQNDRQRRLERLQQALEAKNVPLDFYGKVIDQDSNSLAGVKIKLAVRHWGMTASDMGSSIRTEKETDAEGHFDIHGVTGDVFDLDYVQKDGYELEPNTKHSYGAVGGSFIDPVIFKMWSTNIHERLIVGEKRFHIVPDGRTYVIDLSKGAIAESGEGDLKVWIKYPAEVIRGQTYDWSSEIDVVNGGLLQETDVYSSMYVAPIEGYTPMFQLQQQIKGGQSGSTGTRRFYIMRNNGQEYGRITIELIAPYNDQIPGLVRLQYAINPTGSRILR
jgi:hypothetical protein